MASGSGGREDGTSSRALLGRKTGGVRCRGIVVRYLGTVDDRLSDDLLDNGSYRPPESSHTATSPSSSSELLDDRHSYGCHSSDEMARS